jgi:purine-binding chemotaxis protein CheW
MTILPRDAFGTEPDISQTADYVSVVVDGQLFGLPIGAVHDVFFTGAVTAVPLAPKQISGLINLRGRIVTALCLRCLLGIPLTETLAGTMVVCIEHCGESFGLIVDKVGEVLNLPASGCQPNPLNLDPAWARCSAGIHWLDGGLLVVIDIEALLEPINFRTADCPAPGFTGALP